MTGPFRVLCRLLICGVVGCGGDESSSPVETGDCLITVRAPETGDEFCTKQIINLWWQSEFVGNLVDIDLYDGDRFVANLGDDRQNLGSVSLTCNIFDAVPGGGFNLRVSDSADPECGDSSGNFSIYDPLQCAITVTNPPFSEEGTPVLHGDPMTITWEVSGGSDFVDIILARDGGLAMPVATRVPNSGEYEWIVAARHCGERGYFIRVRDTFVHNDEAVCEAESGRVIIGFAEGDEYECGGVIHSPGAGIAWERGEDVVISFTASNFVGDVARLRLFHEGVPVQNIGGRRQIEAGLNLVTWFVETGWITGQDEVFTVVLSDDSSDCCFTETPPIAITGFAP